MRIIAGAAAIVAILTPFSAAAQVSIGGEAEILSDYRDRGVSLSDGLPALQASVEIKGGGFHLGGFGSWVPHHEGAPGVELDASLGYRIALDAQLSIDGRIDWYHYPRGADCDFGEVSATLEWEVDDSSASAGLAYAPRQRNLLGEAGRRGSNLYGFASLAHTVAGTSLSLTAAGGYESGVFDGAARGGKWDWRLGVTTTRGQLYMSASYVGARRSLATLDERRSERGLTLALGHAF
jgi:uncharacterized protein (TIGR02001 family)